MTGEEITEIRNKLGVTQEKFAALLGTTATTVNRWENNKTKISRLYIKEIKELKINHAKYFSK
jgi:putative transcriptional regulator